MHASRSRPFAVVAALWVSTLAGTAAADLPPPAGFVETCTTEKQTKPGSECLSCSAFHGNAQHCSASLASYGFTQSCRSRGASVWSEVWCRAATPAPAKVPAEVLAQLGDANGHPPAATVANTAAPPPPNLPASPLPSATTAATATTQPESSGPAPQPLPPPRGGCACTMADAETGLPALMLAMSAGAAAITRRRRSRR
jgi:MYXO-CTERM domain-containing protein